MAAVKTKAPTKKTVKQTAAKKATVTKTPQPSGAAAAKKPRVFAMSFASVYPLYVQKAEKKGRTKGEVNEVIAWLTGYRGEVLRHAIAFSADGVAVVTQPGERRVQRRWDDLRAPQL